MNFILQNDLMTEMRCGSNFAYIISDSNNFLLTEYKVLQSQTDETFVKCMKMLYNGNIALYYLTANYNSLSDMLPSLHSDNFMAVVANLFSSIISVKGIGFLSCQNIVLDFNHIFIDPTTYKVSLVYLPLAIKMYRSISEFENSFKSSLLKCIQEIPSLISPKMRELLNDLSNETLSFEDLYIKIKDERIKGTETAKRCNSTGIMKLVAINAPVPIEIEITKDEFVLGRKPDLVDGVISFNKTIGRVHCKIIRKRNHYAIMDLQSANGTYVNGARLKPNQPCTITNGDIIRLANSDFKVTIA